MLDKLQAINETGDTLWSNFTEISAGSVNFLEIYRVSQTNLAGASYSRDAYTYTTSNMAPAESLTGYASTVCT